MIVISRAYQATLVPRLRLGMQCLRGFDSRADQATPSLGSRETQAEPARHSVTRQSPVTRWSGAETLISLPPET